MFLVFSYCAFGYVVNVIILFNFSLVFFFKQKTAYEMRISDWSSDVCSSDLRPAGPPGQGVRSWRRGAPGAAGSRGHGRPCPPLAAREIGRASCRERVCQYV